jgi:hypothetical protein
VGLRRRRVGDRKGDRLLPAGMGDQRGGVGGEAEGEAMKLNRN